MSAKAAKRFENTYLATTIGEKGGWRFCQPNDWDCICNRALNLFNHKEVSTAVTLSLNEFQDLLACDPDLGTAQFKVEQVDRIAASLAIALGKVAPDSLSGKPLELYKLVKSKMVAPAAVTRFAANYHATTIDGWPVCRHDNWTCICDRAMSLFNHKKASPAVKLSLNEFQDLESCSSDLKIDARVPIDVVDRIGEALATALDRTMPDKLAVDALELFDLVRSKMGVKAQKRMEASYRATTIGEEGGWIVCPGSKQKCVCNRVKTLFKQKGVTPAVDLSINWFEDLNACAENLQNESRFSVQGVDDIAEALATALDRSLYDGLEAGAKALYDLVKSKMCSGAVRRFEMNYKATIIGEEGGWVFCPAADTACACKRVFQLFLQQEVTPAMDLSINSFEDLNACAEQLQSETLFSVRGVDKISATLANALDLTLPAALEPAMKAVYDLVMRKMSKAAAQRFTINYHATTIGSKGGWIVCDATDTGCQCNRALLLFKQKAVNTVVELSLNAFNDLLSCPADFGGVDRIAEALATALDRKMPGDLPIEQKALHDLVRSKVESKSAKDARRFDMNYHATTIGVEGGWKVCKWDDDECRCTRTLSLFSQKKLTPAVQLSLHSFEDLNACAADLTSDAKFSAKGVDRIAAALAIALERKMPNRLAADQRALYDAVRGKMGAQAGKRLEATYQATAIGEDGGWIVCEANDLKCQCNRALTLFKQKEVTPAVDLSLNSFNDLHACDANLGSDKLFSLVVVDRIAESLATALGRRLPDSLAAAQKALHDLVKSKMGAAANKRFDANYQATTIGVEGGWRVCTAGDTACECDRVLSLFKHKEVSPAVELSINAFEDLKACAPDMHTSVYAKGKVDRVAIAMATALAKTQKNKLARTELALYELVRGKMSSGAAHRFDVVYTAISKGIAVITGEQTTVIEKNISWESKKIYVYVGVFVLLLLAGGAGYYFYNKYKQEQANAISYGYPGAYDNTYTQMDNNSGYHQPQKAHIPHHQPPAYNQRVAPVQRQQQEEQWVYRPGGPTFQEWATGAR
eukprot:GDKI01012219.1.p1 GENE.GDKI01012219.1~~GDKI01012219.1.p1  ORF type:complete len:1040 (-),score=396.97 GDKI01012219.1:181-3300(-)